MDIQPIKNLLLKSVQEGTNYLTDKDYKLKLTTLAPDNKSLITAFQKQGVDSVLLFHIGGICTAVSLMFPMKSKELRNLITGSTEIVPEAPNRNIYGIHAYVRKDQTYFYSIKDNGTLFSVTITKIPQA